MIQLVIWLIILHVANADNSTDLCASINVVRASRGLSPLVHSTLLRTIAETHLANLIGFAYDPFGGNVCNPHSWFGGYSCCYPSENCMGSRGVQFSGGSYTGVTVENFYATQRTGGFFGGGVTDSGISVNSVVQSWVNSPNHYATLVGNYKICGGAISEYSSGVTYTGLGSAWFGTTLDSPPTRQPTPIPTSKIQPTRQPTPIPTSEIQPTRQPTPIPTSEIQPTQQPTPIPTSELQTQQPTPLPTCPEAKTQWVLFFVGILIGLLCGVLCTFGGMYLVKGMYTNPPPPQQSPRGLHRKERFIDIIKGMLDPNDPDDAELLRAHNSHEMSKIIRRSRAYSGATDAYTNL